MRALALAIVLASTVAHAAPPGQTPVVVIDPPTSEDGPSRSVAVLLSTSTTLGGLLMLTQSENEGTALLGAAVMTVGPSTGRWYAGEASLSGIGLRSLAAVSMIYGLTVLLQAECDYYDYESDYDNSCDNDETLPSVMLLGGGALFIGSAIYDVVMADRAARDYRAGNLTVKPMVQTSAGGATGIALAGHF